MLLLARGKADAMELLQAELLSKAKSFLTEFRASPVEVPDDEGEEGESHSILVSGVPESHENPVEPLALVAEISISNLITPLASIEAFGLRSI